MTSDDKLVARVLRETAAAWSTYTTALNNPGSFDVFLIERAAGLEAPPTQPQPDGYQPWMQPARDFIANANSHYRWPRGDWCVWAMHACATAYRLGVNKVAAFPEAQPVAPPPPQPTAAPLDPNSIIEKFWTFLGENDNPECYDELLRILMAAHSAGVKEGERRRMPEEIPGEMYVWLQKIRNGQWDGKTFWAAWRAHLDPKEG